MPWVKFHEALTKGAKRGIRRAHRMVYMELSLAARPKRGFVELPLGMGDVDGVCDLLGGDVREVRDAIKALTSGAEPMLAFEGPPEARRLIVVSWQRWNSVEPAGSSTERSRRHREASNDHETADDHAGNGDATIVAGSAQRSCNDAATGSNDRPSGDQRREEEIRDQDQIFAAGAAGIPVDGKVTKRKQRPPIEIHVAPTSDHRALSDHYCAAFERVHGKRPTFTAREGKSNAKLLDALGLEEGKRRIDNAFADPFWSKKVTLNVIANEPDKFISVQAALPMRGPTPQGVQPLSDGWKPKQIDENFDPEAEGWS